MAGNDRVLKFIYQSDDVDDRRTLQIKQVVEGSDDLIEVYKFHHPQTGSNAGVTTFQRKNVNTQRWENAGQIEWSSHSNANVYFGIERIGVRELRRAKKLSSKSRRFKAGGAEYKWKLAENELDIYCVNSKGKTVAQWTQETLTLRVDERVESILDRVVVTCIIHLWWMQKLKSW